MQTDALDSFVARLRELLEARGDAAAERLLVGVSGPSADGIEVEFTAYLIVTTSAAVRAARQGITMGILRLARQVGVTLDAAAPAGTSTAMA